MGMVKAKLRGLRNYYGVPGNSGQVRKIYSIYKNILYRQLNRRSERKSYNWKTFMPEAKQKYFSAPWMQEHILQNHGPLCSLYQAHKPR